MDERIAVTVNNNVKKIFFQQDTIGISGADKTMIDGIAKDIQATVIDPYGVLNAYLDMDYSLRFNDAVSDKDSRVDSITADADQASIHYDNWKDRTRADTGIIKSELFVLTVDIKTFMDSGKYEYDITNVYNSQHDRVIYKTLDNIRQNNLASKWCNAFRSSDKISSIFEYEYEALTRSSYESGWISAMDDLLTGYSDKDGWWDDQFPKLDMYNLAKFEAVKYKIRDDLSGTDNIYDLQKKQKDIPVSVTAGYRYPTT